MGTQPRARRTGRRYGIDLAQAWRKAKARILEASGVSADVASRTAEPVARARKLAELAAPADMRLSLALTLGASPAELEQDKSGARLMLEGAHKRLGIVGLRSGDSLEEGMSDRMAGFLRAWFNAAAPAPLRPPAGIIDATARALPPAAAEPAPSPPSPGQDRP